MILTEVFLIILYIFYKSDNLCEKFATGPNMQPGLPKIFQLLSFKQIIESLLDNGCMKLDFSWLCLDV